jgi:hypothetical protein
MSKWVGRVIYGAGSDFRSYPDSDRDSDLPL